MRVLAIDAGTVKAGLALMDGQRVLDSEQIVFPKGTMGRRLQALGSIIRAWLTDKPDLIALEDGFSGGYASATKATAMARGIVLYWADGYSIPVKTYPPTTIKQTVTGHGNATKDEVRAAVKSITGIDCSDKQEDMADAIAIGLTYHLRGAQEAI